MPIARRYRQVVARPRRPTLTALILEKIAEAGETFLDSFFPKKYPEARLWRKILGLDPSYEFRRATFSTIISRLRAQGLVERHVKSNRHLWRLTAAGRTAASTSPVPRPSADGRRRLVCFDIAERERAKRQWLRGELIALGYRPLQKSVWIGEAPLPAELIEDLDALDLRPAVHILRVEAEGTLHQA